MSESVKKVSFKDMDFKFMAAYGQYSDKFDAAESDERKTELNEAILKLHEKEISYQDYYSAIDKESDDRYQFHRTRINTSRKYQYRQDQQKQNRIKRHK